MDEGVVAATHYHLVADTDMPGQLRTPACPLHREGKDGEPLGTRSTFTGTVTIAIGKDEEYLAALAERRQRQTGEAET